MFRSIISQISIFLISVFFHQVLAQEYPELDLEFRRPSSIRPNYGERDETMCARTMAGVPRACGGAHEML